MEPMQKILNKAKELKRKVVLPEGCEPRVIKAASSITAQRIAGVTLLGNPEEILKKAKELEVEITGVCIRNPLEDNAFEDFVEAFYELRKHKAMSRDGAKLKMVDPLFFGAMMVRKGIVDGSVAGSINTTANVLRAGIQVVGVAKGISIVSSSFFMILPSERCFIYADGAVLPDPNPEELASIAVTSAETYRSLTDQEPVVALLSFSTKGSAKHELVDKVIRATEIAKKLRPDLRLDGELQVDAAIVPSVAAGKSPKSPVKGEANVLIFPDLNSGNIAYKLTQRLAQARAIGPLVQGLSKPCFDLSRGCSAEDIVNVVAINMVMS